MTTITMGMPSQMAQPVFQPRKRPTRVIRDESTSIASSTNRQDAVLEHNLEVTRDISSETYRVTNIIEELERQREPLVQLRNSLVDKPFFMLRTKLQNKVDEIDSILDPIDLEIWHYYKLSLSVESALLNEIRQTNSKLVELISELNT